MTISYIPLPRTPLIDIKIRSRSRDRTLGDKTDDELIYGVGLPREARRRDIPRAYLASVPHLLSQQ